MLDSDEATGGAVDVGTPDALAGETGGETAVCTGASMRASVSEGAGAEEGGGTEGGGGASERVAVGGSSTLAGRIADA
jgi:hypothetical protein